MGQDADIVYKHKRTMALHLEYKANNWYGNAMNEFFWDKQNTGSASKEVQRHPKIFELLSSARSDFSYQQKKL